MSAEIISIIAVLIAALSALYSRWAVNEAKKANELSRLKALLELKIGYLQEKWKINFKLPKIGVNPIVLLKHVEVSMMK